MDRNTGFKPLSFQGQRQWTDWLPNADFTEAIMASSFDWNGKKALTAFVTEYDTLNGISMLFGTLLTGKTPDFHDVRTYWSPDAVKRVTGKELEGKAKDGIIHLINSGATALDCTGAAKDENGYVLNICERANVLEKPVRIHQDYHIKMNYLPKELYLVCETPEKIEIKVNGKAIDKKTCRYYIDKSFKKLEIAGQLKLDENTISIDCDFKQSDEFYENRRKLFIFESEKNKLVYDMELRQSIFWAIFL